MTDNKIMTDKMIIKLFLDGDACPVKAEAYRVAERYHIKTFIVSNSFMRIPNEDFLEAVIVDQGLNKADDWIAEKAFSGRDRSAFLGALDLAVQRKKRQGYEVDFAKSRL